MSVKNYIAAFEAHNEVVRNSPVSSPGRSTTSEYAITPKNGESFPPDPLLLRSEVLDCSATGLASHARRSRLQQELDKPDQHKVTEVAKGSLAERRKARQQRKQYLMHKKSMSQGQTEKRESRHTPTTSPGARSLDRQQPESLLSNRRLMKSSSKESEGTDTVQEGKNTFLEAQTRRSRRSGSDRNIVSHLDDDYNDMVEGTDDEVTLTSVRQIMTAPVVQSSFLNEGMKSHNVLRTASSSSFEVDTRLDMYKKASKTPSLHPPNQTDDEDTIEQADFNEDEEDLDDQDDKSLSHKGGAKLTKPRHSTRDGFVDKDALSSPLVNKEDMEHFRRTLDTPVMKTAVFVVGAATAGTLLFGPVGLLLGAATVGIGVGIMQIPQEQRAYMKDKATKTLRQAHESALDAGETLSTSCLTSCQKHGVSGHFPMEVKQCFTQEDLHVDNDEHSVTISTAEQLEKGTNSSFSGVNAGFAVDGNSIVSPSVSGRSRRVACLRDVRITPVDQIHGLHPQKQPRAWLDVLANANTTPDEKSEAMEEVKILSRDKRHARMLLDEGILDSLMYILNRYFDKLRHGANIDAKERSYAKLAASCCVALGKAHCAAVHTEGDLLLMSMYERGTVPEERQLAQMLYEVPHHVLSKEPDVFALLQTSMPTAEELASKIKDLSTS